MAIHKLRLFLLLAACGDPPVAPAPPQPVTVAAPAPAPPPPDPTATDTPVPDVLQGDPALVALWSAVDDLCTPAWMPKDEDEWRDAGIGCTDCPSWWEGGRSGTRCEVPPRFSSMTEGNFTSPNAQEVALGLVPDTAYFDYGGWVVAELQEGVFRHKATKRIEMMPAYAEYTCELLASDRMADRYICIWRYQAYSTLRESIGVESFDRTESEENWNLLGQAELPSSPLADNLDNSCYHRGLAGPPGNWSCQIQFMRLEHLEVRKQQGRGSLGLHLAYGTKIMTHDNAEALCAVDKERSVAEPASTDVIDALGLERAVIEFVEDSEGHGFGPTPESAELLRILPFVGEDALDFDCHVSWEWVEMHQTKEEEAHNESWDRVHHPPVSLARWLRPPLWRREDGSQQPTRL